MKTYFVDFADTCNVLANPHREGGCRELAERLWPRGVSEASLELGPAGVANFAPNRDCNHH